MKAVYLVCFILPNNECYFRRASEYGHLLYIKFTFLGTAGNIMLLLYCHLFHELRYVLLKLRLFYYGEH